MTEIRGKIRSLIYDLLKTDYETFIYTTSSIFTITDSNISEVLSVLKNGVALGSGEYSFDSDTNELTITVSLSSSDVIKVNYSYYKYSNTEISEYVRAALVWISIYGDCENDFEVETDDIYPTPSNKEEDLISAIASILINPEYNQFSLPTMRIVYPRKLTKEKKIELLINNFYAGTSESDVITWEE